MIYDLIFHDLLGQEHGVPLQQCHTPQEQRVVMLFPQHQIKAPDLGPEDISVVLLQHLAVFRQQILHHIA